MFENVVGFFKKLLKKEDEEDNNKDVAKERLHLVLMQDRANVSADFLEMMKQEIIDVIKKYIDVDEREIDVHLTNKTNEDGTAAAPALYANIPIVSIKHTGEMDEEIKEKVQEEIAEKNNKDKKDEEESTKVVSVNEMVIYTIQVASLENESELKKIEEVMNENKIPSSSMSIDNSEKIQAYSSFDETKVRTNLDKTRNYFSDAFLTKIEIPMLSLQYTSSYSYMKDIADGLNDLIENYQKESQYWDSSKSDLQSYNEILTSRKTILENLKKNTEKINYSKMDKFKNNLISYIDESQNNILISSKSANENKGYISQGLLLSSIQQYYVFVQSMK